MKRVIIASTNPVKVNAIKSAFSKMFKNQQFTFEGHSAPSNVSDQPMTSAETLQGAINRVESLISNNSDANYYVGIEGGCELVDNDLIVFAWVVIKNSEGKMSKSRTTDFTLPAKIKDLIINEGKELGEADDIVFGRENSKQSNGSIGILTNDVTTRESFIEQAAINALIPFVNEELY